MNLLIEPVGNSKAVETVAEVNTIGLWRTMADGVDGCCGLSVSIVIRHACVSMFVPLQHQVHSVVFYQRTKHQALYQVVPRALDGVYRMMEHHYFPTCRTIAQGLLQPFLLRPEIRKFAVTVEQEQLHVIVAQGVDLIFAYHGVQKVREDQ